MSFSTDWDVTYKSGGHRSRWPWSDLVSLFFRYLRGKDFSKLRVLELGCGAGANIPFLLSLGVDYHALEGSEHIVNELRERFPEIQSKIKNADFTKEIPFEGNFDIIIDRASLVHNHSEAITHAIELCYGKLEKDGLFIGVDWFSDSHTDLKRGEAAEDPNTRTKLETGSFVGLGRVHFFSKSELLRTFDKFEALYLEHKKNDVLIPASDYTVAAWNFIFRKK